MKFAPWIPPLSRGFLRRSQAPCQSCKLLLAPAPAEGMPPPLVANTQFLPINGSSALCSAAQACHSFPPLLLPAHLTRPSCRCASSSRFAAIIAPVPCSASSDQMHLSNHSDNPLTGEWERHSNEACAALTESAHPSIRSEGLLGSLTTTVATSGDERWRRIRLKAPHGTGPSSKIAQDDGQLHLLNGLHERETPSSCAPTNMAMKSASVLANRSVASAEARSRMTGPRKAACEANSPAWFLNGSSAGPAGPLSSLQLALLVAAADSISRECVKRMWLQLPFKSIGGLPAARPCGGWRQIDALHSQVVTDGLRMAGASECQPSE